jgi:predicted nucleic-acid-binding protein
VKAWDTSVVIRHLTEDDPQQLKIARGELAKSERRGEAILISLVVIIETARVLSQYDLNKAQTLEVIQALADDSRFQVEHAHILRDALERAQIKGDLSEHVAALVGKAKGASKTQTFDKGVKSFSEFEILPYKKDIEPQPVSSL